MKTKPSRSLIIGLTGICLASIVALAGCAGTATTATSTEETLASAGFRLRTPETPKQKQIFADLPAYKVHRLTVGGQTYYIYKDEAKGVAMVGREAEYRRYRQMARQDASDANLEAAALDDAMARDWASEYAMGREWR